MPGRFSPLKPTTEHADSDFFVPNADFDRAFSKIALGLISPTASAAPPVSTSSAEPDEPASEPRLSPSPSDPRAVAGGGPPSYEQLYPKATPEPSVAADPGGLMIVAVAPGAAMTVVTAATGGVMVASTAETAATGLGGSVGEKWLSLATFASAAKMNIADLEFLCAPLLGPTLNRGPVINSKTLKLNSQLRISSTYLEQLPTIVLSVSAALQVLAANPNAPQDVEFLLKKSIRLILIDGVSCVVLAELQALNDSVVQVPVTATLADVAVMIGMESGDLCYLVAQGALAEFNVCAFPNVDSSGIVIDAALVGAMARSLHLFLAPISEAADLVDASVEDVRNAVEGYGSDFRCIGCQSADGLIVPYVLRTVLNNLVGRLLGE
jgi:hypothetical protein